MRKGGPLNLTFMIYLDDTFYRPRRVIHIKASAYDYECRRLSGLVGERRSLRLSNMLLTQRARWGGRASVE